MHRTIISITQSWLHDPLTARIAFALAGLLVITVAGALLRRTAVRYVRDNSLRYRARKVVSFSAILSPLFLFLSSSAAS